MTSPLRQDQAGKAPPSFSAKIAVLREEFLALTGDPLVAIVLNQLVYWSQRVEGEGWFYKTSQDLLDETMIKVSIPTLRRYLKELTSQGWLLTRPHPHNKWDRTTYYRVDLERLKQALETLGYTLFCLFPENNHFEEGENIKTSKGKFCSLEENTAFPSKDTPCSSRPSTPFTSSTKTTTETTNKDHTHKSVERKNQKILLTSILDLWKQYVGREVYLDPQRKRRLLSLFKRHFKSDLSTWEAFCKRVQASPFLMGHGPSGWRVTFDWILSEGNLLKILEGNFDSPETIERQQDQRSKIRKQKEISELLGLIKDPLWKEWCSEMMAAPESQESPSLQDLQRLINAKFLEVEDNKLVWIGSPNKEALNQIEDLRLKLLDPIKKTFPKARNLRTRLEPLPSDHTLSERKHYAEQSYS